MAYTLPGRLPVIYVRGFAGSGIDQVVDDPFYGFNEGSVHVRVDGANDPRFHQFESPLLRLMIDEDYRLLVQGDQRAFLEGRDDGTVDANTLWVHRFYDVSASTFGRKAEEFSLEKAAEDLFALVKLVLRKTGAPRVFLVAHSMGGLICRSLVQRVIPDPTSYVARIFTYATPHGGIEFAVGWGLLEKFRDLTGFQGADIFGRDRMYQYLTRQPADKPPRDFDPRVMPADGFPVGELFCLVGTNPQDYSVGRGLSSWAVGARSDGLVQIDNAYVKDAHRAMVHRSHSGRFGIVNSEEGYQNLRRFLFGDLQVKVDLVDYDVVGGEADDMLWQLETALSIRGLPVLVHEQRTAHCCPVQIERRRREDTAATPIPLLTTFLSSRTSRPTDEQGRKVSTLRHALKLRLISIRERNGVFSFLDHLEQAEDWQDIVVVDIASPANEGELPRAWAIWNSELSTAIRDWQPEQAEPIVDIDPASGRWRGLIPLPPVTHKLLGNRASLSLTVTSRSVDSAAG